MGLLINLLSAYAKPTTDRMLSGVSSKLRKRVDASNARRNAALEQLRRNPTREMLERVAQLERLISGVAFIGLGIGFKYLSRSIFRDISNSPERFEGWSHSVASSTGLFLSVLGPVLAVAGLVIVLNYLGRRRLLAEVSAEGAANESSRSTEPGEQTGA